MSIEQLTIDETARRLQADAQRLNSEIQNYETALRWKAAGRYVQTISEEALEAERAKLAEIRERLAEAARVQAEEREAARREAEAAEVKRQQQIVDARRAALVARMAFDRAQAMRLQTSLGEDVDAYAASIEASDAARDQYNRAQAALAQLED